MENIKASWEGVLSKLQVSLSSVSYELWFEPIKVLEYRDNKTLVLVASSTTAKNQILKNYFHILSDTVKNVFDQQTEIEVLDENDKEKYLTEKSLTMKNPQVDEDSAFNEKYTFDNFVVGKSNQFVYAGARAVAENPGTRFNPFFIYGGVGLGKTHLLHAIGNHIKETRPNVRIMYVTCEKFMNDYIESMLSKREESKLAMREKYRNVDVLMVDDIQFLSGRAGTQEEFFHTFNDLYQNQKQIIISSDRPPNEIATLAERLSSRFASGLTQDIQPPDFETRVAILRTKAQQERYFIDEDVIAFIADKISSNIREMVALLSKVHFLATLQGKKTAGLEEAREAFNQSLDSQKENLTMDTITDAVCSYFNVMKSDVLGKKKSKDIVEPRMISEYLITELLSVPLFSIGKFFGGRDHSTVVYARDKIAEQVKTDPEMQRIIGDIKNMITIS